MKRPPARPPRRWLKLRAVADLMNVEHPDPHYRVKYIRRLLQRLEQRDRTAYLRRFGHDPAPGRRGSDWYVSPDALEALAPYSPTAHAKLRADVDSVTESVTELRRQVGGHGARIRNLEKARKGFEAYMRIQAED